MLPVIVILIFICLPISYIIGHEIGRNKEHIASLRIPCENHTLNETGWKSLSLQSMGYPKYYCKKCRNGFNENKILIPHAISEILSIKEREDWEILNSKCDWEIIQKYLKIIIP